MHCPGKLTRKHVAEAFWNAEVEDEIRLNDVNDIKFHEKYDREIFMDAVDKKRAYHPYPHANCSEECHKEVLYTYVINVKTVALACMYVILYACPFNIIIWHTTVLN